MSSMLYDSALTVWGFTPWVSLLIFLLLMLRKSKFSLSAQFYRTAWWVLALRCALPFPLRLPHFTPAVTLQLPTVSAPHSAAAGLHTAAQNRITAQIAVDPGDAGAGIRQLGVALWPSHAPLSLAEIASMLTILWLAGFLLVLVVRFGSYGLFLLRLRQSRQPVTEPELLAIRSDLFGRGVPLYRCREFCSPALTGFLRKTLYLPSGEITPKQLSMILLHERCHAQRHDLALKLLLVFSTAFCWFNPLVWVMAKAAEEDTECACDEMVLRGKNIAFCQEYGRVLLDVLRAEQPLRGLCTRFAGDKRQLRRRFEAMYSSLPKQQAKPLLAVFCAVVLTASLFFACTPANSADEPVSPANSQTALSAPRLDVASAIEKNWIAPMPHYDSVSVSENQRGLQFQSASAPFDVAAVAAGTVASVLKDDAAYGNCIILDHGGTYTSFYAFLDQVNVSEGQSVTEGASLGTLRSPADGGALLYFELRQEGTAIDAATVLCLLPEPPTAHPAGDASVSLRYPVSAFAQTITRKFTGAQEHAGMDFRGETGAAIGAAADGIVLAAENGATGDGNWVEIDHGSGVVTFYSHCETLLVKAGEEVAAGQQIATIGSTGYSTGPHLHFEVRQNGTPIDPEPLLPAE